MRMRRAQAPGGTGKAWQQDGQRPAQSKVSCAASRGGAGCTSTPRTSSCIHSLLPSRPPTAAGAAVAAAMVARAHCSGGHGNGVSSGGGGGGGVQALPGRQGLRCGGGRSNPSTNLHRRRELPRGNLPEHSVGRGRWEAIGALGGLPVTRGRDLQVLQGVAGAVLH